ncbi:MAG: hypothetical protein O7A04_09645 [Acidobacteria bacterium]|nr:hypothetical protein [Acidobacteriota bacterium]
MSDRQRPGNRKPDDGRSSRETVARWRSGIADGQSARHRAVRIIEATLASKAPVDALLGAEQKELEHRDRALLHELVLGTLRWLRRLDNVIQAASDRPLSRIDGALLGPLRVGTYQLLFLDRMPAYAAVDEAVRLARSRTHRGGANFVNAVLRRVSRDRALDSWPVAESDAVRRLAIEWSHPDFLVERWHRRLGDAATRSLLEANNRPKPLHLLAFRDRGGREALGDRLRDEGCTVELSDIAPLGLKVTKGSPLGGEAFREGDFYVQDEASQVSALLPMPSPGERILDVAAAPGGKSFALLAVEPDLDLTLADISLSRLCTVRRNLLRLKRKSRLLVTDGARSAVDSRFDRVIVDLPCSGTGTLRRHPELKWRLSEAEISRLSREARRLVAGAARLVGSGGRLIVISCSLEDDENDAAVAPLLGGELAREPLPLEQVRLLPSAAPLAGLVEKSGVWRLWTADDHDGFTVHVFARSRPGKPRKR